jgi:hypothetical protein
MKFFNATKAVERWAIGFSLVGISFAVSLPALAQTNPNPGVFNEPLYQSGAQLPGQTPLTINPFTQQPAPAYPSIFSEPLYIGAPANDRPAIDEQSSPGGTPFPANPSATGQILPADPQFPSQTVPEDPQQTSPSDPQLEISAPGGTAFPGQSYPYSIDPQRTPARVEVSPQIR